MSPRRTPTPSEDEEFQSYARGAIPRARSAAVPVFGRVDGSYVHQGSGVLVQLGGTHLLLTAAHVLDAVQDAPILPIQGEIKYSLQGRMVKTVPPEKGRYHDAFDFAAVALNSSEVAGLSHRSFVTQSEIFHPIQRAAGLVGYLTTGYPVTAVRRNWHDESLEGDVRSWVGIEMPDSDYDRCKVSRKSHLLVDRDAKRARGPRGVGRPFPLPGLSGSGVWIVAKEQPGGIPPIPSLSGLFIEKSPLYGRALVSLRIGAVLAAVGVAFPDVLWTLPTQFRTDPAAVLGPPPRLVVIDR